MARRVEAGVGASDTPSSASARSPGVNLVGFLEGGLGLGEVARKLERALGQAGVPFVPISYRRTPTRAPQSVGPLLSEEPSFDTNVLCLNADYLTAFLEDAGVDFFAGRYSIGVWFWESSIFRGENRAGFRFVDEIWVASEYVRRAIATSADTPVHVVPLPIEAPAPPTTTRAELGLPDGFIFLFAFDFVSAQRKNPVAVVEAFKHAFRPGEGPVLVLKGMNGLERKPQWLEELRLAADGRPDIQIVDAFITADERDSMIAACDCYVSLHRSEGFGLTMAEAMAHGKPVVATGYSGNLEFMTETNSYLVPYLLTPVPSDWWAYSPGAEWAEPDVGAAAVSMRRVYEDRDDARARAERGRAEILDAFSLARTARFVDERLTAIRAGGRARKALPDVRSPILQFSQELGRGIGAGFTEDGGRRPMFVRRLLARALWPYLAEQHRLNAMTLDALAALQRRVDSLSRQAPGVDGSPESTDEREIEDGS